MNFSSKVEKISPSLTLSITAKAKQMKSEGIDVIGFGAGEPDFDTPVNIQEAAIDAIKKGYTKYTATSGIIELKNAIIEKFRRDNDLNYKTSQIIISTGAKQCLANIFEAILNPKDEVIISSPYWVSYPELVKLSNGIPVFAECTEDNNFKYTKECLEQLVTDRTKALLINSPNNPTGTIYTKGELIFIAEFAKEHDLVIISDEIYEKLNYTKDKYISIANISDDSFNRTIVINGVSKSYAMTGWRIGYAAGNENIIKLMTNVQSHTTSNPNSIAQYAAAEALNGDQTTVDMMINEFEKRRNYMVKKINSIKGIYCIEPDGAFYVMINISKLKGMKFNDNLISTSIEFSKLLLDDKKVAVIPGAAFGVDDYIRLSYATSMENIITGLDRLEDFISKIYKIY